MTAEVKYVCIYFAAISASAVLLTVYDKLAAKKIPRHRVPEKVLFLVALAGGGVFEYITMQIIRHKTKHKSFMVGLPLIILLHTAVAVLWYFFLK